MKMLNEFAWVDDDEALHIDVPAMLAKMGVPDTDENRERCTRIAVEYLSALKGEITIVTDMKTQPRGGNGF